MVDVRLDVGCAVERGIIESRADDCVCMTYGGRWPLWHRVRRTSSIRCVTSIFPLAFSSQRLSRPMQLTSH